MQQYMQSMKDLMANPQFLQMAEKLGRSIIEVRPGGEGEGRGLLEELDSVTR